MQFSRVAVMVIYYTIYQKSEIQNERLKSLGFLSLDYGLFPASLLQTQIHYTLPILLMLLL